MMRESDIQSGIVNYLAAVLVSARVVAIPNASRRTASGRATNGVPGLTPGVPDLCIIESGGRCVWLEVKADGGKLSMSQNQMLNWMHGNRVPFAVVHGIDEVRVALAHYGVKTREAAL